MWRSMVFEEAGKLHSKRDALSQLINPSAVFFSTPMMEGCQFMEVPSFRSIIASATWLIQFPIV